MRLGTKELKLFLKLLESIIRIEVLDLSNNNIEDGSLFGTAIYSNRTLLKLVLSNNFITQEAG